MAAASEPGWESRTLQTVSLPLGPVFPGCIAWSAHAQLAIGLEHAVHVIDASFAPGDGEQFGARPSAYAFEPTERLEREASDPLREADAPASTAHDQLHSCSAAASQLVRAVCWSPAGFAPDGGCALLALTHSGRVEVALPPRSPFVERVHSSAEPSRLLERNPRARGTARAALRTRAEAEFVSACAWDQTLYAARALDGGHAGEGEDERPPCSLLALGTKRGLCVLACLSAARASDGRALGGGGGGGGGGDADADADADASELDAAMAAAEQALPGRFAVVCELAPPTPAAHLPLACSAPARKGLSAAASAAAAGRAAPQRGRSRKAQEAGKRGRRVFEEEEEEEEEEEADGDHDGGEAAGGAAAAEAARAQAGGAQQQQQQQQQQQPAEATDSGAAGADATAAQWGWCTALAWQPPCARPSAGGSAQRGQPLSRTLLVGFADGAVRSAQLLLSAEEGEAPAAAAATAGAQPAERSAATPWLRATLAGSVAAARARGGGDAGVAAEAAEAAAMAVEVAPRGNELVVALLPLSSSLCCFARGAHVCAFDSSHPADAASPRALATATHRAPPATAGGGGDDGGEGAAMQVTSLACVNPLGARAGTEPARVASGALDGCVLLWLVEAGPRADAADGGGGARAGAAPVAAGVAPSLTRLRLVRAHSLLGSQPARRSVFALAAAPSAGCVVAALSVVPRPVRKALGAQRGATAHLALLARPLEVEADEAAASSAPTERALEAAAAPACAAACDAFAAACAAAAAAAAAAGSSPCCDGGLPSPSHCVGDVDALIWAYARAASTARPGAPPPPPPPAASRSTSAVAAAAHAAAAQAQRLAGARVAVRLALAAVRAALAPGAADAAGGAADDARGRAAAESGSAAAAAESGRARAQLCAQLLLRTAARARLALAAGAPVGAEGAAGPAEGKATARALALLGADGAALEAAREALCARVLALGCAALLSRFLEGGGAGAAGVGGGACGPRARAAALAWADWAVEADDDAPADPPADARALGAGESPPPPPRALWALAEQVYDRCADAAGSACARARLGGEPGASARAPARAPSARAGDARLPPFPRLGGWVDDGSGRRVPRCAATMLVVSSARCWHCRVCERKMLAWEESAQLSWLLAPAQPGACALCGSRCVQLV